LFGFFGF